VIKVAIFYLIRKIYYRCLRLIQYHLCHSCEGRNLIGFFYEIPAFYPKVTSSQRSGRARYSQNDKLSNNSIVSIINYSENRACTLQVFRNQLLLLTQEKQVSDTLYCAFQRPLLLPEVNLHYPGAVNVNRLV